MFFFCFFFFFFSSRRRHTRCGRDWSSDVCSSDLADTLRYDAVVIGAGTGGYPCGIRLGQLGVKALVVDKEYAGGVCLNVGCIPSKAVIHASKMFDKVKHLDE